jgi:hypothetical protein
MLYVQFGDYAGSMGLRPAQVETHRPCMMGFTMFTAPYELLLPEAVDQQIEHGHQYADHDHDSEVDPPDEDDQETAEGDQEAE